MALSEETIKIIKATTMPVTQHAQEITSRMYEILFQDFPETKVLFENADEDQHIKLAGAIGAFAANIDNLSMLDGPIDVMVSAHVSRKVDPKHYPMVGVSLLKAIKEVLGDAATEPVLNAWKEAFFFLADILIAKEREKYSQA